MERLDKLIAASGKATRSEAKNWIRSGRVTVNGVPARSPEQKCDAAADVVAVDGIALGYTEHRYIMMHKPAGVISATEDREQRTVLDLLPEELRRQGLFPVGRLDKDVTGLLILTNDGALAHALTAPKKHVPKTYCARVDGVLDETDAAAFAEGLVLADGARCRPARLEIVAPDIARVTVCEGKYHQVKRMFAARGKPVAALHRERMGGLALDASLPPGGWRELTDEDIVKMTEGYR